MHAFFTGGLEGQFFALITNPASEFASDEQEMKKMTAENGDSGQISDFF